MKAIFLLRPAITVLLFASGILLAADSIAPKSGAAPKEFATFPVPLPDFSRPQTMWPVAELYATPVAEPYDKPEFKSDPNIRAVTFEGVPWKGKPTRVFAWVGLPARRDGKVPGMVLVHGGGGTAYKYWVKLWNERGYAAIAMDTCGSITPEPDSRQAVRGVPMEGGGPAGWGNFGAARQPPQDQWPYHAVAAVIRAHSLLRSLPEVDAERIGLTGISWGGYLTNIVAGVDDRFRFAAPIYGCGFLGEDSSWQQTSFQTMPREEVELWLRLWDPSQYVGRARMPMVFCNGTNDKHYHPEPWQKTYRLAQGPRTLSFQVRMRHGHPPAGDPLEVSVYADALLRGGAPLPIVKQSGRNGNELWAEYSSVLQLAGAEIVFTRGSGDSVTRHWETAPATIDHARERLTARIPVGTTWCYFNLKDVRGCVISTEHETLR